jgi:superfamily II DNA or RNA helicase
MSLQRSFVVPGIVASSTQNQQMQNWLRASQSQSWESAGGDVHPSESTACLFKWGKSITERLPMLTRCDLDALLQGSALEGETWFVGLSNHCFAYLAKVVKDAVNMCEESGNYLVLQMLRQDKADVSPPSRGFYCLQQDSLKCYSTTAVRLIAFLIRVQRNDALSEEFKRHLTCEPLSQYMERPSTKNLHAVFVALCCPILTETTHDMCSHVCAFMRLASLGKDLVVDDVSKVMQVTSRLKYLIRSCILVEVRSVGVYSVHAVPVEDRMAFFQRFILQSMNNVMSRVVCAAKVAFSVSIATFTSVSTSSDGAKVSINNKTVMLTAIQGMVHSLFTECNDLLTMMNIDYRKLSGTHSKDEITLLNLAATESGQNASRVGFNIFNGTHFELKGKCLEGSRWFKLDGEPNVGAMQAFSKHSASLQQRLFVLLHLTVGSPSRGAEMTRWRWQTTPNGPSCFRFDVVKHLIYLFYQSTKTSRSSQSDKYLVKYMGEELTRLFVAFAFVRRLEVLFSVCVQEPKIYAERLQSHIFVIDGLPLNPQDYSQILRTTCLRFSLPSMGLREFRQVMIAFGKFHLQQFSEISAIKDHVERYMAYQSGHSVSTHRNTYGQLKGAVCEADMQSFMVSSFAYLWLLRLPVPKVGSQLVPSFGTSMSSSRNNEESVFVALGDDAFGSVPTSKYIESVSLPIIQDSFYNEALKRIVNVHGRPIFKGRLQQHAVAAVIKGEELLYVAPCGSGKSSLIWLGLEKGKCTVCIVPYRTLRVQLRDTAESMAIRTKTFSEEASVDHVNPPELLICMYEQIPFLSSTLYKLGCKLLRIILDEIQVCFSEEFRLIVCQFQRWRAWLSFGVPIVYMSGSFPKSWEHQFQEAFGCPASHVPIIRESVVRQNVALEFVLNDSWFNLNHICAYLSQELVKQRQTRKRPFKTMIFVMNRRQCADVQKILLSPSSPHKESEVFMYWSGQEVEDQAFLLENFQSFRRSPDGVLICTHAGAIGADIEGVSLVFHLEGAHSLVSYFQATGRCGRDGSPAVAIFMSNIKLLNKCAADEQVVQLALSQQCKRRFLSNYFDGEGQCFPCHGNSLCTSCKNSTESFITGQFAASDGHRLRGQHQATLSAPVLERCWNFKHIMDAFAATKTCAICFIFQKVSVEHVITICPTLNGGCVKCGERGHWGKNCPVKFSFKQGIQCYVCMCPFKLLEVTCHGPTVSGASCYHPAKDRLSITCWFFFRLGNSKTKQSNPRYLEMQTKYAEQLALKQEEFSKWLSDFSEGICNMVTMFGDLISWRYV